MSIRYIILSHCHHDFEVYYHLFFLCLELIIPLINKRLQIFSKFISCYSTISFRVWVTVMFIFFWFVFSPAASCQGDISVCSQWFKRSGKKCTRNFNCQTLIECFFHNQYLDCTCSKCDHYQIDRLIGYVDLTHPPLPSS